MAVTTKKLFAATSNATTTVFSPVSIQLNNQDDLDVYVTLSGGTRVLQLRQSTGSTAQSSHPQVNNTDGLYFPAVSAGTTLYNYQLSTDNNTITFNSALPQGAVVFCERRTRDADSSYTSFASGSTIRATDLNNSSTESNFTAQDGRNKALTIEGVLFRGDQPSTNFVTSDHIVAGTIVTQDIANDAVNADKIADDVVNSEHYVAQSIDTEHIALENITTALLAPDAVTSAKLADNAVDSEHYVDGSVDHVHLANDAVDGDNIADDSINSEHYVDGSIDTAHIAADQITNALIADNQIDSEHYVDGSVDHVHLANDCIDGDNIQDDVVNSEHIAAGALDNEHYAAGSITSDKLNGATVVTASEQAAAASNDTSFLTTAAADARFFNVSTGDTIKDGDTFPDNDTTIATTAAINDRIIDLVDDVGGFVPLADELTFPNVNPDLNNGYGTVVSIKALSQNYTSSNTGVITIPNGTTVQNDTVTITGAGNSVTYQAGFGLIVETTVNTNQYVFHRLVPKATEVTTVAGKATEIGRLGTAAAVEDLSILGTADVVADLNTLGTADVVSDLNTLGTADVVADMNTLAVTSVVNNMDTVATNVANVNLTGGSIANVNTTAGSIANVNTVAGSIANVNTTAGSISNVNSVAGSIANVNTTASNLSNVNNFAATYQIASSAPSTDGAGNALAAGDLYFDTSANELRVHNGSTFQGGVTATGNLAGTGANTFTGNQSHGDNVKNIFGTGNDLEIFHNSNDSVINEKGTGSLKIQNSGSTILDVHSGGAGVTGNITVSGNVDGRDVAADGVKIDGLTSSSGVLTNGVTATTQAASDNTTKVATTAYTTTAIANINTDKIEEGNSKVEVIDAGTGYVTTEVDGTEVIRTLLNQTTIKNLRVGEGWNMDGSSGAGLALSTSNSNDSIVGTSSNGLEIRSAGIELKQPSSPNNHYAIFNNNGVDLRVANVVKAQLNSSGFTLSTGLLSGTDSTYDIGTSANRFANIYGDNIYGNGSNLTNLNIVSDTSPQLGGNLDSNSNHILLNDSARLKCGAGEDLQIFHEGSNSYIQDSGTGSLYIKSSAQLYLQSYGGETFFKADANGAVELYYDNSKKFETNNTGCHIFGNTSHGDGSADLYGDGNDLSIYHDGLNSYVKHAGTGNLRIETTGGTDEDIYIDSYDDVFLQVADGYDAVKCIGGGAVELYHSGNKKFETTSGGGTLTGTLTTTSGINAGSNISMADNVKLKAGTGDDLQIYHDGNNGYLENSTGTLYLRQNSAVHIQKAGGSEKIAEFNADADVELYYDGSKKFETTSAGVDVNGTITCDDIVTAGALLHEGDTNTLVHFDANDQISLKTNGSTRLQVTNSGAAVTGTLTATSFSGDGSNLTGVSSVGGATGVDFNDNVKARFGTGNDLELYHNGTDNYINSSNGNLYLQNSNGNKAIVKGGSFSPGNENIDLGEENLRWQNVHGKRFYGDGILQARVAYETNGTYSIYDSYGVSSLGDNGTGYSDVNFSTSYGNNNYAISANGQQDSGGGARFCTFRSPSNDHCEIEFRSHSNSALDAVRICALFSGDQP